jgi:hypothetical protein
MNTLKDLKNKMPALFIVLISESISKKEKTELEQLRAKVELPPPRCAP